jgi:acetyl-CoA C-acetyltransferase
VGEIKVKTVAMTSIGRHARDYRSLLTDVIRAALAVPGVESLDAVFLASFAPSELCGIADAADLARDAVRAAAPGADGPVFGPFRTGGEAMFRALEFSRSRPGDILVAGCEKMTHLDAGIAAGLLAPRVSDHVEQGHGATLPALAALASTAYARSCRVPAAAFDEVAVKNHHHATLNPLAHFRRSVAADEVRRSPLVADPLRRYHCAPMSDGAAACVLSRRGGAVRITGWGHGVDAARFHDRARLGEFRAASAAASAAFAMAARSPADVDVVEIHDAFSPFELMNLEAMGFFAPGDAWRALARGELAIGGCVAVNPSGGLKARGHPIGVCGLTSTVEVYTQLTGAAGARQHPGAGVAVVQSAGGVSSDCYAFVMESCV